MSTEQLDTLADARRWRALRDMPASLTPEGPLREWLWVRPAGAVGMDALADEVAAELDKVRAEAKKSDREKA